MLANFFALFWHWKLRYSEMGEPADVLNDGEALQNFAEAARPPQVDKTIFLKNTYHNQLILINSNHLLSSKNGKNVWKDRRKTAFLSTQTQLLISSTLPQRRTYTYKFKTKISPLKKNLWNSDIDLIFYRLMCTGESIKHWQADINNTVP